MSVENAKGQTTAFCTFTPFRSRCARFVHWAVLKLSPVETDAIRLLQFLHYMCFASVSPRALKRAQLEWRGAAGAMLFMSAYNGKTETYFRGFNQNLAAQMDQLWGGCVDWKGASVFEYLSEFIEHYRRPAAFHFNAYPDTSTNLRAALQLRAALDELVDAAHDQPQRFVEQYRRAAHLVCGERAGESRAL